MIASRARLRKRRRVTQQHAERSDQRCLVLYCLQPAYSAHHNLVVTAERRRQYAFRFPVAGRKTLRVDAVVYLRDPSLGDADARRQIR